VPTKKEWETHEGVARYSDEGEAFCISTDTAESIPELLSTSIQREDNNVGTGPSSPFELSPVSLRSPNKPSGSLVLVGVDHSPGGYKTSIKRPNDHT
jgi:hypothetical protein